TGVDLRIIVRAKTTLTDDNDTGNLISSDVAILEEPTAGYAHFDIQASELDWAPGEYPFVIVLNVNGYSSVIVKGFIDLVQNVEFGSMDSSFSTGVATQSLELLLKEQVAISVYAGQALAPGTT